MAFPFVYAQESDVTDIADETRETTPPSTQVNGTPGDDSDDSDALTSDAETEETRMDEELRQLAYLSLEELMTVNVTSVQGTANEWFRSPAAIYVITGEDVRRSGHRTLAEALRMVPGMFVGQIDSNTWRIGARGLTGAAITSTKNLVLIDGRAVYDPLFSGTFWESQDVLLEDLDRIEAIRGPGATLWGANAVNGVINITTKNARDTQGWYLSGGFGDPVDSFGSVRYGGRINNDTWFRIWGKYDSFDSFSTNTGESNHDDWSAGRAGFRIDGNGADNATWMVEGELYSSLTYGQSTRVPVPMATFMFDTVNDDGRISGGHIQLRLEQNPNARSGWSFNTYYDNTSRVQSAGIEVNRHTFDTEYRNHFALSDRNELMWGGRFNLTMDDAHDGPTISLDPNTDTHWTISGFVQNTNEIIDNTLFGMIGTKLEYNDYTGIEVQPSARLWWTPDNKQTIWAAVSRAVRVPSRIERDGFFTLGIADSGLLGGGPPSGVFVPFGVGGDDELKPEELIAYELGHRIRLTHDLTLDTALFYNDYDRLISVPGIIGTFNNAGEGETYGVETSVSWRLAPNWRLEAAYSFVKVNYDGPVLQFEENNAPENQAQLRSYLDLTDDLELNGALYYVDNLGQSNADAYLRLDVGATWRVNHNFDITVWGQNLLDPSHNEASNVEIPRGFYVQGTLRF